jgi:hypothetical protein
VIEDKDDFVLLMRNRYNAECYLLKKSQYNIFKERYAFNSDYKYLRYLKENLYKNIYLDYNITFETYNLLNNRNTPVTKDNVTNRPNIKLLTINRNTTLNRLSYYYLNYLANINDRLNKKEIIFKLVFLTSTTEYQFEVVSLPAQNINSNLLFWVKDSPDLDVAIANYTDVRIATNYICLERSTPTKSIRWNKECMAGDILSVCGDGMYYGDYPVQMYNGFPYLITNSYGTFFNIGIKYLGYCQSLYLGYTLDQNTRQVIKKNVEKIFFRSYNSVSGKIGFNDSPLESIREYTPQQINDYGMFLNNIDVEVIAGNDWREEKYYKIIQDRAEQLIVTMITLLQSYSEI